MAKKDLAVFAIIEDIPSQEGKIVLVCDGKKTPYKWKLPGGKNNTSFSDRYGENYEITLYREVKEEINVNVFGHKVIFKKQTKKHPFIVCSVKYYSRFLHIWDARFDVKGVLFRTEKQVRRMIASGLILPNHAEALTQYLDSR